MVVDGVIVCYEGEGRGKGTCCCCCCEGGTVRVKGGVTEVPLSYI